MQLFSKDRRITITLAALNTVLFAAMVATSDLKSLVSPPVPTLIDWGANFGPLTLKGEPWRLITCAFVHGNLIHLLVNMYALVSVGKEIEKTLGPTRYLFIYFMSALMGALVSTEFQPTLVSCGASGAIFGIVGAAFSYVSPDKIHEARASLKRRLTVLIAFVILNLAFGFIVAGIDNAAHMGGLIGGLLSGFVLSGLSNKQQSRWQAASGVALLSVAPLAAYIGMLTQYKDDPRLTAFVPFIEAQALLQDKKYNDALPYLDNAISTMTIDDKTKFTKERIGMLMARTHTYMELKRNQEAMRDVEKAEELAEDKNPIMAMKALVAHQLRRYDEAVDLYKKVLEKTPDDPQVNNNLAWSQLPTGQLDEALKNVTKAIDKDKNKSNIIDTRGTVYLLMKNYDRAIEDLDNAIKINPKEGAAYFHRAGAHLGKGQDKECDEDLKASKELDYVPDVWEVDTFRELIERRNGLAK
ncbi:MAG: rhomboid family intramembrane serine protease [Candidatus Obscuribacterales bacterium]|nr:rhomboid family intramembrane serine protease [Candidatus Obscuribacterales bacterium]